MALIDAARRATVAAALSTMSLGAQSAPTRERLAECGFVAEVASLSGATDQ